MKPFVALTLVVLLSIGGAWVARADDKPLAIPDSPRIAFIGNTFVERDQQHGYFETRLITAFPEKDIVFRNLGWSGDTVRGEARAGFGQPIDGFNHLVKQVGDVDPNLVLLNYGLNESYAGPAGLSSFGSDLNKLLDALGKGRPTIVILSIMAQENLGPPLPNPDSQNKNIRLYNQALARSAASRGLRFVDLYDVPAAFAKANAGRHFTDDEIHPTAAGYAFVATEICRRLGVPTHEWNDRDERIRRLTVEKNQLYFHRWRPQNQTYIFGFRKAEQGRNAVEIPQFDPLIAQQEAQINALKK